MSEETVNQWLETHQEFLGYVLGQLTHIQQTKAAISQHFQSLSEEDKEKRQLEFQDYIRPHAEKAPVEALQALQQGNANEASPPMIMLWKDGLDFRNAFSQVLNKQKTN